MVWLHLSRTPLTLDRMVTVACRTLHERLTRTIPTDSVSGLHSSVLWVISGLMSGEGKRTWWESRDVGSAPAPAGTDEELLSLTVGTTYFLPSEWKGNLCFLEKKQRKFILSQQAASLHCLRFSFSLPPFLSLLPHTPLFSMPLFPFPSTYSRCSLHPSIHPPFIYHLLFHYLLSNYLSIHTHH